MRPDIIGKVAKTIAGFVPVFALTFAPMAFSQETISSQRSLEIALENAVMCKLDGLNVFNGGEFDGGPADPQKRLEALGVNIDDGSNRTGEMRYRFPRGVKVFGYEASEAVYSSESITTFFVNLRSPSDRLGAVNKVLRLISVPKGNPDGYGYFNEFQVRDIRKLSDGKVAPPDTIFSGIGGQSGHEYVVVGCQNLAW
jgi:hypothetical protein